MDGYNKLKEDILDRELCTSCGTCIGVCPVAAISFFEEQIINATSKCINCGKCIRCCPGKEFDFNNANKNIFGCNYTGVNKLIGYFKNIYSGYSTNETVRKQSASGGIITELLIWLKESEKVDGVVVVQSCKDNPLQYKAKIVTTIDEITNAAQSKYKLIPTNEIISKILKLDGKFAYVGLPCQIQGLRKAMFDEPKLKEKIYIIIGLFCGFNMSEKATDYLLEKGKITRKDIEQISYRKTLNQKNGFYAKDLRGKEFFINKHGYTFLNLFYSPKRCWKCYDYTSEFSDISVGDAWEQGNGWSRIIVRSDIGQSIINKANYENKIFIKVSSTKDIIKSQKTILSYKKIGFWIRTDRMKNTPEYNIDRINLNTKNNIKFSIIYLIQLFGQTKLCKAILHVLPIRVLERLSSKLRK